MPQQGGQELALPTKAYIGGAWTDALTGADVTVLNPATEQVLGTVPGVGTADLDRVCSAAQEGFEAWRRESAWQRSAILRRIGDILRRDAAAWARVMTLEQGKPLDQAMGEVNASADQFDWYADEARRIYGRIVDGHVATDRIHIYHRPIGPVAAFAPWNFPLLLPVRKAAAALAAGCSVVLAAPPEAPYSSLLLGLAADEAGLPAGALNIVTGDLREVSADLVRHPGIAKISVTSSTSVGITLGIEAASVVKPVTLELGGHAPVIVLPGADVEAAARACAVGKFRNGGQVCISASRFFVPRESHDQFVEAFVATTQGLTLGNGLDDGVDVGPLSTRARVDASSELVGDAVQRGATVVAGGAPAPGWDVGFFFAPTVLTGVDPSMSIMRNEPFAPVAPIASYDSLDEAIAAANSTPYGLGGFVFGDDLEAALGVAERLEVGMVGINHVTIATAEAPFGGVKQSGFGREGGSEGVHEYLTTQYVSARPAQARS